MAKVELFIDIMDSGNSYKHLFERSWPPNAHISSQCPLTKALPYDKLDEFIARRNPNYRDGVNNGSIHQPQNQERNYLTQPTVQHRQHQRTETRQIGGLRQPSAIMLPTSHSSNDQRQ